MLCGRELRGFFEGFLSSQSEVLRVWIDRMCVWRNGMVGVGSLVTIRNQLFFALRGVLMQNSASGYADSCSGSPFYVFSAFLHLCPLYEVSGLHVWAVSWAFCLAAFIQL